MASSTSSKTEVVVTGMGVVSPIGIGNEAFWAALAEGRGGVGPIRSFDASALPVRIAAEVPDFDPKQYVRPRKSLKVMSRDMQFAVASASMAAAQARLEPEVYDPQRVGVVMGADRIRTEFNESVEAFRTAVVDGQFNYDIWSGKGVWESYPLMFLKSLPNLLACHVSIAQDARGPNNTIQQAEASSLLAIGEAARVIERGAADAMFAGGASSRMHPLDWVQSCLSDKLSRRNGASPEAPRPFDTDRDGQVRGEGAAVFLLESRRQAEARGVPILARVLGWGAAFSASPTGDTSKGGGLAGAITSAMKDARLGPADVGHINAHGAGTFEDDPAEARVLASVLPQAPVTALKSYFGNSFAATGALEMAGSVQALAHDLVPMTLNHRQCDSSCPVQVVHNEPLRGTRRTAMVVNETSLGQAVALLLGSAD